MNIKEYVEKHGIYSLFDTVSELVRLFPKELETPEVIKLMETIGENFGDLIYALGMETKHMGEIRKRMIDEMVKKMKK